MALSRLGDYITVIDIRNSDQKIKTVFGLNNKKEFMPTVATIDENSDISKYKLVEKGMFVFSGMQTGRDQNIRIGYSDYDFTFVISPAYTTFKVINIIPTYFFMIFKSTEMDRYGAFLSDSSVRSNLDWDVFCNIELDIPPIEVQQKVVDVYLAMVANQKAYEKGLDDLKKTCDSYIENFRKKHRVKIGDNIFEVNEKNSENINEESGVSVKKEFIKTKSGASNISNQKVVRIGTFALNSNTSRNGNVISIALNKDKNRIVSNTYICFKTNEEVLNSNYLFLWFKRNEFDRFARFNSWGSARETIGLKDISEYEIALPNTIIQRSISVIYEVYGKRSSLNDQLKKQINEICPVLIKGSIDFNQQ